MCGEKKKREGRGENDQAYLRKGGEKRRERLPFVGDFLHKGEKKKEQSVIIEIEGRKRKGNRRKQCVS